MTAKGLPISCSWSREKGQWIQWLTKVPWNGFQTLTFAPRPSELLTPTGLPSLSRVRRAASRLEKSLTGPAVKVSFFGVVEVGSWNGRMHLHALTYWSDREDEWVIRGALEKHRVVDGFVRTLTADSGEAVAEYVTKYVLKARDPIWIAGGPAWPRMS